MGKDTPHEHYTKAGVAIFIRDKADINAQSISRDKKKHFIMTNNDTWNSTRKIK